MAFTVSTVATTAYTDQAPGTSGLRKKTVVFKKPNYLANFIQSIFDALPAEELAGSTIVLAGDGRYYSKEAGQAVIKIAAANGVGKVLVAQNFLMSTPGVSELIRTVKAYGGILMTASHNPGGPENDFGVKYNVSNGGPAPEKLTDAIFAKSKVITAYKIAADLPDVDVTKAGAKYSFAGAGRTFEVEVVDSTAGHVALFEKIFDFAALKEFVNRKDFSLVIDSMHGAGGPAARKVFVDIFGLDASSVLNSVPSEDFGGGHPDPNLTYAENLVKIMGLHADSKEAKDDAKVPDFGAAFDGDADRNMILGKKFFVTPSDSLAIIAANATTAIPYFKKFGLSGVARSMPTSQAVDHVAAKLGLKLFETPTGWKFFGNLLDAKEIALCGEESFGTGSDHIREKDGLWAVLAWLSILQTKSKEAGRVVSVAEVVKDHWAKFGRNFYTRYDYEEVDKDAAVKMFDAMRSSFKSGAVSAVVKELGFELKVADEFTYKDPVDGSISERQGLRVLLADGSRVVYRMSGTGSVGATVRVYVERYSIGGEVAEASAEKELKPLVDLALKVADLVKALGRERPSVIT